MRVIPLTSLLSHKGRGSRSPNLDDTLSLDVKELLTQALKERGLEMRGKGYKKRPVACPYILTIATKPRAINLLRQAGF